MQLTDLKNTSCLIVENREFMTWENIFVCLFYFHLYLLVKIVLLLFLTVRLEKVKIK